MSFVLALACDDDEPPTTVTKQERSSPEEKKQAPAETLSLLDLLPSCEVHHRGLSIDVGTPSARAQRSYSQIFADDVKTVDRGSGGFAAVEARNLEYDFWLSEPLETLGVTLKVHGRRSGRLAIYVDGRRLGGARLSSGRTEIVGARTTKADLKRGRHTLGLRLSKGERGARGPYVEVDWIRLSSDTESAKSYAAPTQRDIVTDVVLEKRPRRSIALHADSSVRCPLSPSKDSQVRSWLGFWGSGRGRAQINLLRPGRAPLQLDERELLGGQGSDWVRVDLPLWQSDAGLGWLELRVLEASPGGRVAFGDPQLRRGSEVGEVDNDADTVVIVLFAGVRRQWIPPWGPASVLPELAAFARGALGFSEYRVPSTVPASVLASILSGRAPRVHSLEDRAARLPSTVPTVAAAIKQTSGRAAMFTSVPTSFAAFGFDRDWDVFEELSPVNDVSAEAPFDRAGKWLTAEADRDGANKKLVLVYARGAHPPWDITKEQAATLKPKGYQGPLDPRRGAITLGNIRSRSRHAARRIGEDDWTRLQELSLAALKKQDKAFGEFVGTLKKLGLWERSLVIVAGDVGQPNQPELPFDPEGPLTEDRLYAPLVVKFPGGRVPRGEVSYDATAVDVAVTVFEALRLTPPQGVGRPLATLARGETHLAGRALWATLPDSYATRLGTYRLSGVLGRRPTLCELAVDPACVNDALDQLPLVSSALYKWTYLWEQAGRAPTGRIANREPASIDPDTSAALAVWGDL